MIALLQRVSEAKVTVDDKIAGEIGSGLLIFLGVFQNDALEDTKFLTNKIVHLRLFDDDAGKMNRSLLDVEGAVLVVSQFTLCADTKKGRRPSFIKAAQPKLGEKIYNNFIQDLKKRGVSVATGIFGAMMDVQLVNDGPVTFLLDSKISLMSG
tara:strand:+ start:173 stop:631 length:459 start_codon:yes stop_codon:yes gene_type:complete